MSNQRIPYAQWKLLHPEKYGAVSGPAKGRGKYSMKKFGRDLNKAGKSDIGRMVRKELKSAATQAVIAGMGKYTEGRGNYTTGRGDYHTNALVNGDSKMQVAKTNGATMDEHGSIMVSKREFVTSINATGSADFSVSTFNVNPALKSVFPWLSQSATNFDEYESIQMIFEYESVISETSVSSVGSLGTVILAANYNAGASAFTSFPQMVEYGGAVRGKISDTITCGIESDPAKMANDSCLYTRAGAVPAGQDIKTYDLAKFQLGLYGVPTAYVAGTQIGLLFVRYVVKLSKPKLYDSLGYSIACDQFQGVAGAPNNPLGLAPTYNSFNSLGGTLSKASGSSSEYTFPDNFSGTVNVFFSIQGGTIGGAAINSSIRIGAGANIESFNAYITNPGVDTSTIASNATDINSIVVESFTVLPAVTPNGNFIDFAYVNPPGGTIRAFLCITEINGLVQNLMVNGIPV